MNEALQTFIDLGDFGAEAVDRFMASQSFPMVDASGVTFVYRGDADEINLRSWVYGLPTSQPLERIEDSDLWALVMVLPEQSRIEYKFEVVTDHTSEWIVDPLNPVIATDPFGANSVCQGYGYEQPDWTVADEAARKGLIEEIPVTSRALDDQRSLSVYIPARFRRSRRYPLLVVHDGYDFLRYADMHTVLDNLIHRLEIPQMIVALTQSPRRLVEYAGDEAHARFLTEEVLPLLAARLPLLDQPSARGLMGASFGAVSSLYTAWRFPGVYGRLLLQSGSFAFSDIGHHPRGPTFDPVVEFVNEFRANPGTPSERLFVSCGIYESLIYENRSLIPLLQQEQMEVRYEEVRDGHNWQNWRDRLQAGLTWLFPGPLWMVYE